MLVLEIAGGILVAFVVIVAIVGFAQDAYDR